MLFFFILVAAVAFAGLRMSSATDRRGAIQEVLWTVILALIMGTMFTVVEGVEIGAKFFTGYAMEWVLSFDNLLAISMILAYFKLPKTHEPKILQWGLISVAVTRFIATLLGNAFFAVAERPTEAVFSIIILVTIGRMLLKGEGSDASSVDHNTRWYIRGLRRWFPVTADVSTPVFFKKAQGYTGPHHPNQRRWVVTPLFLCLAAIEATDLMFSFDSIPAVLSVTHTEPLVTYSAMLFSVMGLRSAYQIFNEMARYFEFVPLGIVVVLLLVAVRMMLHALLGWSISPIWTLLDTVAILGGAVWFSKLGMKNEKNS